MRSLPICSRAGVDPPDGVGVGRADVALAAEVLARLEGEHRAARVLAERRHLGLEHEVHPHERGGDPIGALLGEHELEVGVALQDAAEREEPQGSMHPERRLHRPDEQTFEVVVAVVRAAGTDVRVQGHVELRTPRPERLVAAVVPEGLVDVVVVDRQEQAAVDAVFLRPGHRVDRVVDVGEGADQGDTEEAVRVGRAEVGEPPVVRAGTFRGAARGCTCPTSRGSRARGRGTAASSTTGRRGT